MLLIFKFKRFYFGKINLKKLYFERKIAVVMPKFSRSVPPKMGMGAFFPNPRLKKEDLRGHVNHRTATISTRAGKWACKAVTRPVNGLLVV